MAKKLIALILTIPILTILILFSATKTVSNIVEVAVSKIEILNDKVVYLNLDDNETHQIDYAIYPINAQKKDVSFSVSQVGDEKLANLDVDNGRIIPKSDGVAKVTIQSVDGGYTDSVIVYVSSTLVSGIKLFADADLNNVYIGDQIRFSSVITPSDALDKSVSYTSSNPDVISISSKGVAKALSKGTSIIRVTSNQNSEIYSELSVSVKSNGAISVSSDHLYSITDTVRFTATIDVVSEYDIEFVYDDKVKNLVFESVGDVYSCRVNLDSSLDEIETSVIIKVTVGSEIITKEVLITKTSKIFDFSADTDSVTMIKGGNSTVNFDYSPEDAVLDYNLEYDDSIINVLKSANDQLTIIGLDYGYTSLTISASNFTVEAITIDVIVYPNTITIDNLTNSYGIKEELAIGKYDVTNGVFTNTSFALKYSTKSDVSDSVKNAYFKWTSSNDNIASFVDGKLVICEDGYVDLTIGFMVNGSYYSKSTMKVRCIKNGVNVNCYSDLMNATNNSYEIVVQSDITDFGINYNGKIYKEMVTTYDSTFYENIYRLKKGMDINQELTLREQVEARESAKVKILVDFTKNVYGNGFMINAHNIAYGLDETESLKSSALFRGPLNFVALTEDGSAMVSVKGQDNISFAIRDNVCIDNVILKSCDNVEDLNHLNYVGTTVEVLGNNVDIINSRLMNGRNVLRIFGTEDPDEKINVSVKASILSYAREFIIRAGSNKVVEGNYDAENNSNPSPYLDGYLGNIWTINSADSISDKTQYDNDYINTFLTIKNCIFRTCGIFAIGLDSHFSGPMLDGAYYSYGPDMLKYWFNLAKTSYGVKLNLEGQVKFYNWIDIDALDSSTLIENLLPEDSDSIFNIRFNISKVIKDVRISNPDKYENIVSVYNGKDYVHNAISIFGGGKNYSYINFDDYASEELKYYQIALRESEDAAILEAAAGSEKFRFYLFDNRSTFKPLDQSNDLLSGMIYDWIYDNKE